MRPRARPDWTKLDLAPLPNVDVVHDLDDIPLPFEDASFDHIECFDILEHVREFPDVMREMHRITAPGGRVHITGPHFTSYTWATDPTHRRAFAINTFEFFATASLLDRDYYFDFAFSRVANTEDSLPEDLVPPVELRGGATGEQHRKLQGFYESSFLARPVPSALRRDRAGPMSGRWCYLGGTSSFSAAMPRASSACTAATSQNPAGLAGACRRARAGASCVVVRKSGWPPLSQTAHWS